MAGAGPVEAGAVLLVGGRSTRMGEPKAALDWHGSPLVRRLAGLLLRAVPGPVLLVAAPGQPLPPLPPRVGVLTDPEPDLGPLAGLATGLAGLAARAVPAAFACSVDLALLHPALVRVVLAALPRDGADRAAAPEIDGRLQPLAAAYPTGLAPTAARLLAAGERRATALLEAAGAVRLGRDLLLADPDLAGADPRLHSLTNLNRPAEYRAALALPAPEVVLVRHGVRRRLQAWTLGDLPGAGLVTPRLNGVPVPPDPQLPLLPGDLVELG